MTDALIAELESAAKGSRDLDTAIWKAARCPTLYNDRPYYSRSLDAALTLVPEGWFIANMFVSPDKTTLYFWCANNPGLGHKYRSGAPTPALALCIAALRARQAMEAP